MDWPRETAGAGDAAGAGFIQPASNICLDFHGDPLRARLVVASDGNHHMALRDVLAAFLAAHPAVGDIFYSTTPPSVALQWLDKGHIDVGNLRLSARPHVLISPPAVLDRAIAGGHIDGYRPFMRSRGLALLVRKGNPKGVRGAGDLLRADVRLFLSNPVREKVSHAVYRQGLQNLAASQGVALHFLDDPSALADTAKLVLGAAIHHREAPQALADGVADVAVVFYHLALRYQRIFPEAFELVRPEPWSEDQAGETGRTACGLVGDGGAWGGELLGFLATDSVTQIYRSHGLESIKS
ncbi:MAG: substrate-binding domain-containing protein [Rhodocyclales bacterium]|nr:substrate-binding domain-containing protein [Rhodocyclales bacterium]